MVSTQSIHSTTDNDKSNEYIKLPLTFGAMRLENVLKYPGIDLKYLNFKVVPKQFYNLFIAESSLARRLGNRRQGSVYCWSYPSWRNRGNSFGEIVTFRQTEKLYLHYSMHRNEVVRWYLWLPNRFSILLPCACEWSAWNIAFKFRDTFWLCERSGAAVFSSDTSHISRRGAMLGVQPRRG